MKPCCMPIGFAIALLAALGSAAALGAQPTAAQAIQRTDTIVKQAGRPAHPNGGTLEPELTIGVANGAPEYMFGSVRDVLQLRDGSTLVLDGQAFALRQYDAKGVYVRTIGRRGQGPGEYTRPSRIAALPDGRILLVDGGTGRINVYSPSGESVATWALTTAGIRVLPTDIRVDTTGTTVVTVSATRDGVSSGPRLLRLAPDGRVVDTVAAPDFGYTRPMVEAKGGTMSAGAVVPFFPETPLAWSPLGYMVSGLPTRYAFELRMPSSRAASSGHALPAMGYRGPTPQWTFRDPIVSIRRSIPAVEVPEEQRSASRAGVEAILRNVDPGWRYFGPDIPRVKPPYKDLRVGEDGTIWIQLSMPGERYMPDPPAPGSPMMGPVLPQWREPTVYDVFEPGGRYLGRLARPANVSLFRMARDRAWGTVRDDDDLAVVRRFRIVWR